MNRLISGLSFLYVLLFPLSSFPQNPNPEKILAGVEKAFDKVKDYTVNVNIKVDVSFLKVPETKAKLYYKNPDKIHFESDGFALLPKDGMNFSPSYFLRGNYTSFYMKEEIIDGQKTHVIKVIPLDDEGDVILSTIWVDQNKSIIRKVESTTKINGTFLMEFKYDENDKSGFNLPSSMVFTFNVDKMNIPKTITGELDAPKPKKEKEQTFTEGKVYVNYSGYKVNTGLSDNIFEKKKTGK